MPLIAIPGQLSPWPTFYDILIHTQLMSSPVMLFRALRHQPVPSSLHVSFSSEAIFRGGSPKG